MDDEPTQVADLLTYETAARVFAQIPPDLFAATLEIYPPDKVPGALLALLPSKIGPWHTHTGGSDSIAAALAIAERARDAAYIRTMETGEDLPVERLLALNPDGEELLSTYVEQIKSIVQEVGGLNFAEIAFLILRARGMTKKDIRRLANADAAKRSRVRNSSPSSALAFANAVRKESKKTKERTAWGWLEEDMQFDGFDIIAINDEKVTYKYNGKARKPITRDTFDRRWKEHKKK